MGVVVGDIILWCDGGDMILVRGGVGDLNFFCRGGDRYRFWDGFEYILGSVGDIGFLCIDNWVGFWCGGG